MSVTGVAHRFRITWLAWVLMLVFLSVPTWSPWVFPVPLRYAQLPIPVTPVVIHAGEPQVFNATRCNDTWITVSYTSERRLVRSDNLRIVIADGVGTLTPGCTTTANRAVFAPLGTPPGIYHLEGVGTVPTPWRTYAVPFETATFEVRQ